MTTRHPTVSWKAAMTGVYLNQLIQRLWGGMLRRQSDLSRNSGYNRAMAESLKEIRQVLKANKKSIVATYGVKGIGIFGSYVRGDAKKRSDIDILVDFNTLPDVFMLIDLEEHLKSLLKKSLTSCAKERSAQSSGRLYSKRRYMYDTGLQPVCLGYP